MSFFVVLPARAWTSAQVEDVRARITLSEKGDANVLLDLGIAVHGGWLERFDLEGLSPELELDPDRPGWLMTAEGSVVAARVTSHEGAVSVRFDKRDAARKGLHRLLIAYRAPLAEGSDAQRLAFALPGFQRAIGAAEISIDAPKGVRAVREPDSSTEVSERVRGERVEVLFRRTHWPRATPWTVEVAHGGPAASFPVVRKAGGHAVWSGLALAAAVLVLCTSARASLRRRARKLGIVTAPYAAERVNLWLLGACCVGLAAAWVLAWQLSLLFALALALLCVDRPVSFTQGQALGTLVALNANAKRELRRRHLLEWLGAEPWADAFTLSGFLGFAVLILAPVWALGASDAAREPWVLVLWCTVPSWVASSRVRLPRSPMECTRALLAAARELRLEGCGLRVLSYRDARGVLQETRLRVVPASRYAGLLRLDVSADSRRLVDTFTLCVVVRRDSPADRWLQRRFAPEQRSLSPGMRRAAYLCSVSNIAGALDDLFAHLSRESQAQLPKRAVVLRAA